MSLKHYNIDAICDEKDDYTIFMGTDTNTNNKVFLYAHKHCFENAFAAIRLIREIIILKHCDHPNIIKILNVFETSEPARTLYSVTPRVDYSLRYFNRNDNRVRWNDIDGLLRIQNIIYGILEGVKYLHENGIVHRNLNMENILVNDVCEATITNLRHAQTTEGDDMSFLTSVNYAAPELFRSNYSKNVDIWSIGCIFMELLTGEMLVQPVLKDPDLMITLICALTPLYKNDKAFQKEFEKLPVATRLLCSNIPPKSLREKHPLEVLPASSLNVIGTTRENAISLAESLLKFDPQQRPRASVALNCAFFASMVPKEVVTTTRIVDIPECSAIFQHLSKEPHDETVLQQILDAAIQKYGEPN